MLKEQSEQVMLQGLFDTVAMEVEMYRNALRRKTKFGPSEIGGLISMFQANRFGELRMEFDDAILAASAEIPEGKPDEVTTIKD